MDAREYACADALLSLLGEGLAHREEGDRSPAAQGYDPDLLYVECRQCGQPLLWEKGKTDFLLRASGVDTSLLDAACMIQSDGCPRCRPGAPSVQLHIVRITSLSPEDLLLLGASYGRA